MADYMYMLESRLTPEQQRGVNLVTEVGRSHGMNVYLVGGVVRDILSGANLRDLDFAVQGNAIKLQKDLEKPEPRSKAPMKRRARCSWSFRETFAVRSRAPGKKNTTSLDVRPK